jgi:hypothetical protein
MAKSGARLIFKTNAYVADRGDNVPGLAFSYKPPYDLGAAGDITAMANAIGADELTAADKSLCPVAAGDFSPRKVTFVRASGNSFSVVIPSLADLLSKSNAVKTLIDATDDKLACAVLKGEAWLDLVQELRNAANYTPAIGRSVVPSTGGKQLFHSGQILYEQDGGTGQTPISVKVASDVAGPPTKLGNSWVTCVGEFEPKVPCRAPGSLRHRRYVLTSKVAEDPTGNGVEGSYETTEVPHRNKVAADIKSCGRALANLTSTICLGYRGESNGRFHLLLT